VGRGGAEGRERSLLTRRADTCTPFGPRSPPEGHTCPRVPPEGHTCPEPQVLGREGMRWLRMTARLCNLAPASEATLGTVASRHARSLATDSRRDQAISVVPAKAGTQAGGLSLCLDGVTGQRRGHGSEANRAKPRTEEATAPYARDRSLTIVAICSQLSGRR